jgi:hypothetical protein
VGELAQRVTNHLWNYLDSDEVLAVVDSDCRPDHLGKDVHAAAVGLDDLAVIGTDAFE